MQEGMWMARGVGAWVQVAVTCVEGTALVATGWAASEWAAKGPAKECRLSHCPPVVGTKAQALLLGARAGAKRPHYLVESSRWTAARSPSRVVFLVSGRAAVCGARPVFRRSQCRRRAGGGQRRGP
jgi:hypothetical protein